MSKNQLFSIMGKKDYNNILEKVIEKKDFTANTKSLLLSMFYKIENSYDDYKTTKVLVKDKQEFIEEMINVIKTKVTRIILVEPHSDKGVELTEQGKNAMVQNGIIFAHPTENALISGITEMSTKNYHVNQDYRFISKQLKEILELGYIEHAKEVIYDFDGWSWNAGFASEEQASYNLIFFNMLVLLGFDFMEEWRVSEDTSKNFIDKAEVRLIFYCGKNNKIITMNRMFNVLAKILINDSPEEYLQISEEGKNIKEALEYIENRPKYLEDIYQEKKRINNEIKNIDNILLDKECLEEEYQNRNSRLPLDNQIFSKNHLVELLKHEREELFGKLKGYNVKLDPNNYITERNEIVDEYKKFAYMEKIYNSDLTLRDRILSLQRIFLKNLQVKVMKIDNKKDIIDLIYLFRYYKYLRISENEYIKDIPELQKNMNELEILLLERSYKYNVFVRITQNSLKTIDILSRILDTKIIDLHDIKLVSRRENKKLLLDIYDGEVLDTTLEIADNVPESSNSKNRKISLFL